MEISTQSEEVYLFVHILLNLVAQVQQACLMSKDHNICQFSKLFIPPAFMPRGI